MGRCESALAAIGFKILLSDLVAQLNEKNIDLVKEMMNNGFIDDENEFFNETYNEVIDDIFSGELKITDAMDLKDLLKKELETTGNLSKQKFSYQVTRTLDDGSLLSKYLLLPVKPILSTDRWGYERNGTNGTSRATDFDFSIDEDDVEKYKDIQNYTIVFILKQDSG